MSIDIHPRSMADRLADVLLEHASIEDCHVLARRTARSDDQLVAYVVASGRLDPHEVAAAVRDAGLPEPVFTPVAVLPRREDGTVDEDALAQVAILTPDLLNEWERQLSTIPGVREAAAIVAQYRPVARAVHLADLFPDWRRAADRVASPESDTRRAPADAAPTPVASSTDAPAMVDNPPLEVPLSAPRTLAEALQRAAETRQASGVTYVSAEGSERHQTYAELLVDAQRVLGGLRARGLRNGQPVLLQLASADDFLPAFWACQLGGFVPVPVGIAPSYSQSNATLNKLRHAWQLLSCPPIVASPELTAPLESLGREWGLAPWTPIGIDALRSHGADTNVWPGGPDDLALLLLTSGSTGMPKAVMQSHRALLARSHAACEADGFSASDVWLNWLPLDHVGGLVMCHIGSVYSGGRYVHAPAAYVLEQPLRWLELIDRHRATATWAPNFAYALVNAQADALEGRRFDLSSMRYIINGGEAVVAKTARRFLELLEPYGLPATAMRPAWGMSETCSAVASSGVFRRTTTTDADVFVSVGPPLPGVAFRIADAEDAVVPEGVVGRFQVKGQAVTTGYFGQPDVTAASFTRDGWFTTGDLAFIRDGQLTIAGRQKDDIIINGVNFYCQDIEAHVEEVPGVAVSFTAACAVRVAGSETDELAILFSPTASDDAALVRVLSEIRRKVVAELGVNPTYLVPLDAAAIPKTEIGKIQRARLRQQLENGEFELILRRVDVLLETANTIPDWCAQPVWRRQPARYERGMRGATLLFASEAALTSQFASTLHAAGPVVRVMAGRAFKRIDASQYEVAPHAAEHYRELLASCARDGVDIGQIVHAWSFAPHDGELPRADAAAGAAASNAAAMTALTSALADRNMRSVRLLVVSAHAQQVSDGEPLACERTVRPPIVRAIAAEHPALQCTHVDLPLDGTAAAAVQTELAARAEPEVAYRGGSRWVRRLRRVDLAAEPPLTPAFTPGGVYAITGALGGVGLAVAAHLLQSYKARLLLIGRAPAADRAPQLEALRRLAVESGGDLAYVSLRLDDSTELDAAFRNAEARWAPVRGVLHLAGAYHDRAAADEDRESLVDVISAKVGGATALAEVLARRDAWFVGFSSALSFFSGAMVGGYAAANRYLESLAAVLRQDGRRSGTIAWSTWDQTGMSRGHAGAIALRARGFRAMAPGQAVQSLVAALDRGAADLIVGVDPRNAFIRRQLVDTPPAAEQIAAFVVSDDVASLAAATRERAPRDAFGTPVRSEIVEVSSLPRAADGGVDRARLLAASEQREYAAPQTDRERAIAAIWQDVLGGAMPGIHDNFFESGGHSLLAAQVLARVKHECGVELPLRALFEAPTVQALAQRIDEAAGSSSAATPDEAAAADGALPLSYAQQRLWFLDRLEPGSTAYNIPIAFWIRGPLDVGALESSLATIVSRHETLRTRFPEIDGLPALIVDANASVRLERIDLNGTAEADRERIAREYASADAQRPFNLADGPLLRVTLLAFDRGTHALLVTFHHIIADGWSLGVFSRELSAAYAAATAGVGAALPALPMQYAEYAAWQRRSLEGERLQSELAYWTDALDAVPLVIALPADRPRPAVQTSRGTHRSFSLPSDVVARLQEMSRREGATPFMTLLAAFETLLHRYSTQDEFLVSTAVANRDRPETEPMIGCLINVLLMRADATGDPTFAEMVGRVRESALQAFAHQQLPFEKLVEALHPDRDLGYNPLAQVMFVYLPEAPARLSLGDLDVRAFDVDDAATPYDLQLHLWPAGDRLEGVLHYSTDLFDSATIDRMVSQFGVLLKAAVSDPHARINRLPLLEAAETRQLVDTWNRTERSYESDVCVHQLVDRQAQRSPDAVAVADDRQELTYGEVRRRSNQLARYLRSRGVGPDVLVGIALDRTVDLVVGLLGILKAGGAYVPLDRSYPAERLQYMLDDSQSP
ncbi:MAG TPA: SDR family NAD(P)-dependent oxidoreductase, partial [Vicinamibacterales bacterium]|nr:SDR family NAD(P)-dependent oxidoreductase [Vicinamibacterales bacterium]